MKAENEKNFPKLFSCLIELGCLDESLISQSGDGFFAEKRPLSEILALRGIKTFSADGEKELLCGLFFDDWYIYSVSAEKTAYGLFKMREQEYDAKMNREADGDVPGVTVSFVELDGDVFYGGLLEPTDENRKKLADEINRVAAKRGRSHSAVLKKYFLDPASKGPYLIAGLYTDFIASLSKDGFLPVPEKYSEEYKKTGKSGRIARFIAENNDFAQKTVCDNEKIFVEDPKNPSTAERLAILATHCGNTSFFSFAAEIQFHAFFLSKWAKIPVPLLGKNVYESAVRADMSIGDAEFSGPTPYYRNTSAIVKKQLALHSADIF